MDIELTVYDAPGRKAETLVTQRQESGRYSISFDAQTLCAGVYTYRLIAHDEAEGARASIEKRMIVVK